MLKLSMLKMMCLLMSNGDYLGLEQKSGLVFIVLHIFSRMFPPPDSVMRGKKIYLVFPF